MKVIIVNTYPPTQITISLYHNLSLKKDTDW